MDPIGSSCFNLNIKENEKAILEEKKQEEQFTEMIISCKSLSHYEGKKFKVVLPQILAATVAALFHIVVGISLAYSAIIIPQITDNLNGTNEDFIYVTETECSWIASIITLVNPFAAIISGFVMDSIGRLNTIKMAAIPCLLGWILIATATDVTMILVGRFFAGFGSAWGASPAIVYITEIAKADLRGSLISMAPGIASLGMVLAYLEGWVFGWRLVAWLCIIYIAIPVVCLLFIPESPSWLVSKGRFEEARKSLEWIQRYQPQPEHKSESFAEMQLSLLRKEHSIKQQEQEQQTGNQAMRKLKLFFKPTGYKPILILSGLFFFQTFSGIYITLFYAVSFFAEVGSDINPYLASILVGTVRFFMSMINTMLMKRFERRKLLGVSAIGMAICMGISGMYTQWIHEGTTMQKWVPLVMMLLYVVASIVGLLSIPWTMTAELVPLEIRGVAHSISYAIANLLMFASIQSYYGLRQIFGGVVGVQYFFAVISLFGLVYSFIFLPETHKKKLSEIESYFMHNTIALDLSCKQGNDQEQRKPIVKNRARNKDFVKAENEQANKMISNNV